MAIIVETIAQQTQSIGVQRLKKTRKARSLKPKTALGHISLPSNKLGVICKQGLGELLCECRAEVADKTNPEVLIMADVLTRPIKDMSDEDVRATETYKLLEASGLKGAITADALLAVARTALNKVRAETSRFIAKSETLEFIALVAEKGLKIPEGGRLVLHPDGSCEVRGIVKAGGARRFRWSPNDHYPRLVGNEFIRPVQRSDEDKNGDYKLRVNKPLASRPDVPFSLVLTSPNGSTISYPARKKGTAEKNETDDLMSLIPMSQWQAKVAPHAAFSLHENEAFDEERESAEAEDESEELDDVGSLVEA